MRNGCSAFGSEVCSFVSPLLHGGFGMSLSGDLTSYTQDSSGGGSGGWVARSISSLLPSSSSSSSSPSSSDVSPLSACGLALVEPSAEGD